MARPGIVACGHIITPGTPLEPPEYCGDDADWLTELCAAHTPEDTSDQDYDNHREATRF